MYRVCSESNVTTCRTQNLLNKWDPTAASMCYRHPGKPFLDLFAGPSPKTLLRYLHGSNGLEDTGNKSKMYGGQKRVVMVKLIPFLTRLTLYSRFLSTVETNLHRSNSCWINPFLHIKKDSMVLTLHLFPILGDSHYEKPAAR